MTTQTKKAPAKEATKKEPDPTNIKISFSEAGEVSKIDINPKEFYDLPLAVRGELLMKARNHVEKEYLKLVKEYAQTESLAQARKLFGAEDQKKAM